MNLCLFCIIQTHTKEVEKEMDLAYIGYQHIISAMKNLQFHDKGPFL